MQSCGSASNAPTETSNGISQSMSRTSNSMSTDALSMEEIQSRRDSYYDFLHSLPKICSPTVCGTYKNQTPRRPAPEGNNAKRKFDSIRTPNAKMRENASKRFGESQLHLKLQQAHLDTFSEPASSIQEQDELVHEKRSDSEDQPLFKQSQNTSQKKIIEEQHQVSHVLMEQVANIEEDHIHFQEDQISWMQNITHESTFNWSIDQLARLNPVNFTIDERQLNMYNLFERSHRNKLLREADQYFAQKEIIPSPRTETPAEKRRRRLFDTLHPPKNGSSGERSFQVHGDGERGRQDSRNLSCPARNRSKSLDCIRSVYIENYESVLFMRRLRFDEPDSVVMDTHSYTPEIRSTNQVEILFNGSRVNCSGIEGVGRSFNVSMLTDSVMSPIVAVNDLAFPSHSMSRRRSFDLSPICGKNTHNLFRGTHATPNGSLMETDELELDANKLLAQKAMHKHDSFRLHTPNKRTLHKPSETSLRDNDSGCHVSKFGQFKGFTSTPNRR